MKLIKNIIFMFSFSWKISKRAFAGASIRLVLDTAEPFIYIIFPALIIDELTIGREWNTVLFYICLFIACIALLRGLRALFNVFVNMSVNRSDVKNALFYMRSFLELDYEKQEDEKIRDIQNYVSSKVRANSFILIIFGFLTSFLKLAGFSYIIAMLHPAVLLLLFGLVVIRYFLNKKLQKNDYGFQPVMTQYTRIFDYLFDAMTNFANAKEVRVNKANDILTNKFNLSLSQFSSSYKTFLSKQMKLNIISKTIDFVQMLFSYGYVAWLAVLSRITVGEFSLYINAVYNLSNSFNELAARCVEFKYLSKYIDDYYKYKEITRSLSVENEIYDLPEENAELPMFEFDHVSFTYPNTEKAVLKDISIKIYKGRKLSVVGFNGAGKTTFIKLLCRLYRPTLGMIKYYGVDISVIKREQYLKALAVVFQDYKLFSFSFLDNIVLNQDLDEDKLNRAVRNAGLESKLAALPKGLQTNIYKDFDEEGIEFSGGEGQKLVIARAYYKDADLVILDEPTAALDALAENEIYTKFNDIISDKTAIFISHRLASTRFCDEIAVFQEGRIVEYGSHDVLMERNGVYADMFNKQAQYYNAEEEGVL